MASLVVEIEEQPLEQVAAELVVVGFAPDDRPLRGAASRADWRFCGELWRLLDSGRLSAMRGQAALLTAAGSLRSPLLMAVGLGPRDELAVATWLELGRDVALRALDLGVRRAVLGLASDAAQLGAEGTHALFGGVLAGVAERGADLQLALAGEGAAARIAELRSLDCAGLPAGVRLRLPEVPKKVRRVPATTAGDFPYEHSHRFK